MARITTNQGLGDKCDEYIIYILTYITPCYPKDSMTARSRSQGPPAVVFQNVSELIHADFAWSPIESHPGWSCCFP